MAASKVKNLILLILLIACILLLAAVIPTRLAAVHAETALYEKLSERFSAYGITLHTENLPRSQSLYSILLADDAQETVISALLGSNAEQKDTGNFYTQQYVGKNGTVSLSANGEIDAALTNRQPVKDASKDAKKILSAMNVKVAAVESKTEENHTTVTIYQNLLGVPVLSDTLCFQYTDGALCAVSGFVCAQGSSVMRSSENSCISCADALVYLLSERDAIGWVGSEVLSAKQGYLRTATASSQLSFVPVWLVQTDTETFYINGISREISRAEADGTQK